MLKMRSHLTRQVFRRLIQGESLLCSRAFCSLSKPCLPLAYRRHAMSPNQRRTIFGMNKDNDKLAAISMDPGFSKMLELEKRIQLVARHPPAPVLADAFNKFIAAKKESRMNLEDFHAVQLLQTFLNLESRTSENQNGQRWLSWKSCYEAMVILAGTNPKFTEVHEKLARALYKGIQDRRADSDTKRSKQEQKEMDLVTPEQELGLLNSVLCRTHNTIEARTGLVECMKTMDSKLVAFWPQILKGFVNEDNEVELLHTVEMMRERTIRLTSTCHQILTLYFAKKNKVEDVKKWHKDSILNPGPKDKDNKVEKANSDTWNMAIPREQVYRQLLEFCLRNNELEWGKKVLVTGLSDDPEKAVWDVIFQAAAATGRGVDEIDRMMGVMVRRNEERGQDSKLDIATINGLVEFAMSRKDAYTAERYLALGENWGIAPNARSYMLQIEYRLDAKDYDGAIAAYAKLRQKEIEKKNDDFPIMNKMVQVLAPVPSTPNTFIMELVHDLSERKIAYHMGTITALTLYHLKRDEYFEVVDLLTTYAYLLSTAQRTEILDLMVAFALEPSNDTGRIWDIYMIFHQVFNPETSRSLRTQFMSLLFNRRRPDLATHIFTSMTAHPNTAVHPDLATYVAAFEGIAHCQDADALEIIHNLLKLDTNVDPCTQLLTAMMLAYVGCDKPHRAFQFWDEISTSREGPSYATLHAMFRACEVSAYDATRAEHVWSRLIALDVEIGPDLAASYIGALAGNALFPKVKRFVLELKETIGIEVDELIIGTLFNATLGYVKQVEMEKWIKENYPAIWATLEAKGLEETELGFRKFTGIDRTIKP